LIGPIAYLSELFPQLARRGFGRLRQIDIKVGATLLVVGLAKKILIADPLGSNAVDPLFGAAAAGNHIVPLEAGLAMVAYTAQLYFDFSGYSDMALGIARMFGLRLPINFNSPLRATGIIDFWRRWHITLTRVIAKVLFTPLALAGTRFAGRHRLKGWSAKLVAVWLPILLNFEVIALWHGAQATFFAFGIFHGLWFIFETEVRATRRWKAFAKKTSPNLRRYLGQAITFAPLVISFALFRSHSMADFGHLLAGFGNDWLGVLHSSEGRALSTILPLAYLILAFAIIWLAPNANEMMRKYRPGIVTFSVPSTTPRFARLTWRPTLFWALLVMALALKIAFSLNAPTPFVYGGF
jgi:D-alanyl-lipoteichoic acid acyltransferase DltB (MBOAT superfamily)